MILYYGFCTTLFGLIFGSFLNCTAMRLVRGEDFVKGRSKCPHCGHELTPIELIPVLSYLLQKGRCRHCKEKISPRYIATEITFALLSLGLYLKLVLGGDFFNISEIIIFFRNWVLTGCLFIAALTDLESMEIHDGTLIFGLISYIIFAIVQLIIGTTDLLSIGLSVLAGLGLGAIMLLLSILMDKVLKKESLGGGDIKLFALLGLYLGFFGAYELIILSCILGLLFVGVRNKVKPDATKEFPFGPALACSGYIILLVGQYITEWYLSMIFI